jgi:hypothetical protein
LRSHGDAEGARTPRDVRSVAEALRPHVAGCDDRGHQERLVGRQSPQHGASGGVGRFRLQLGTPGDEGGGALAEGLDLVETGELRPRDRRASLRVHHGHCDETLDRQGHLQRIALARQGHVRAPPSEARGSRDHLVAAGPEARERHATVHIGDAGDSRGPRGVSAPTLGVLHEHLERLHAGAARTSGGERHTHVQGRGRLEHEEAEVAFGISGAEVHDPERLAPDPVVRDEPCGGARQPGTDRELEDEPAVRSALRLREHLSLDVHGDRDTRRGHAARADGAAAEAEDAGARISRRGARHGRRRQRGRGPRGGRAGQGCRIICAATARGRILGVRRARSVRAEEQRDADPEEQHDRHEAPAADRAREARGDHRASSAPASDHAATAMRLYR